MAIAQRYRTQWESMLGRLRSHPEVDLVHATLRPPASEEAYKVAQARHGEIPSHVRGFFEFCNGLELHWTLPGGEFGGSVCIGPIDSDSHDGPLDALDCPLDAYGFDLDRAADHIHVFDTFCWNENNIEFSMLFYDGFDIAVSTDDIACITDSYLVTLPEYIDLVLRTYGSPMARLALQQSFANQTGKRAVSEIPAVLSGEVELSALIALVRAWPDIQTMQSFFR